MSNLHLLANYCNNKDDGAVKQYYKSKHLFQGQNILVTNFPSQLFIRERQGLNVDIMTAELTRTISNSNSYILYLFDMYMEDELNFLKHCELLNRYLENNEDTIVSLTFIIAKLVKKYFSRQNDNRCLQCVQTLFDNIKLFTKDIVTILFYRLLIDRNMDTPMSNSMNTLPIDMLKTFLPYIDVQKVINITSRLIINEDIEKALGIFNNRTIETINLPFILLNTETYDCLEYMLSLGYNFYHPKLGYNFDWEACHVSKPYMGLSRNNMFRELPQITYKTLVPNQNHDKYLNMLKIYRLIILKNLNDKEFEIIEKEIPNLDLTLTYDYNVSPYVMCRDRRVLELFKKYNVNMSNENGRFYIQCEQKLILEFMLMGIDPRPSIELYKRHIKTIPNSDECKEEREFFQTRLEELIENYKVYKLRLYEETKNNDIICNDVLKLMIGEYL